MNRTRKYAPVSLPRDSPPAFKRATFPASGDTFRVLQDHSNDPSRFGIGYDSRSSSLNNSPLTTPGHSRRNSFNPDSVAQSSIGLIGAAAVAAPVLAPVAAAAGIGYGIYKLGESFNLW